MLMWLCLYNFQCESDLAEAIPALEAAIAALNTLKVCSSLYKYLTKELHVVLLRHLNLQETSKPFLTYHTYMYIFHFSPQTSPSLRQ